MNRLFGTLIMLALWGCGPTPPPRDTIVATTTVVADWVSNVAGDRFQVISLVGRDGDTHVYEATPQDNITLSQAKLVVSIGAYLEDAWLPGLLAASGTTAPRLILADKIALLPKAYLKNEHGHEEEKHKEEKYDHHHGEFDPHIWQSVVDAVRLVSVIRDQLIALDPEGRPVFESNAAAYIAQLEALHQEISTLMATIPETNRKLVTAHHAFGYFARDYGLEQSVSVLQAFTTKADEPSAREMADLVNTIRAENIRVMFDENILQNPVAASIAREAGIRLAAKLYSDSLGQPGTPGETYLGMMRYNAQTIAEALR